MQSDTALSAPEGDSLATLARDKDAVLFLKDATKFKTDGAHLHGKWIIETLRRYEDDPARNILAPIERAVTRYTGSRQGRKRLDGRYYLAYLAFVFSRHADVRPFWQNAGHSIWTSAGFRERPSYQTLHLRFTELQHPEIIAAFEQAAARLIQLAHMGSHGLVGRYVHVDSTEAETHARLEHVCPPASACWRKKGNGRKPAPPADPSEPADNGDGAARPDEKGRAGRRLTAGESVNVIREERHDHAVEPEPEHLTAEDTELGAAELVVRNREKLRVKVGSCIYDVLDPTAGIRAYTGPNGKLRRFWVGFYNAKAIDHFTGAPVAVRITSASTPEFVTYPQLLDAAIANTGAAPRAVVGDRGYSVSSVFEHNTRRGIAWVFRGAQSGRA